MLRLKIKDAKTLVVLVILSKLLQGQNRKDKNTDCRFCRADVEAGEHIMGYCGALTNKRKQHLGAGLIKEPARTGLTRRKGGR